MNKNRFPEMWCGLPLVLTIMVLATPAMAQDVSKVIGDWQLHCDAGDCRVRQGLASPERPGIVYSSEVKFPADQDQAILTLSFPLGIYLPSGVGLRAGDETYDIPVTVCLPIGCQAIVVLDEALEAAMKEGDSYNVRFYTTKETPNEVRFSLNGFDEVFKDLTKMR